MRKFKHLSLFAVILSLSLPLYSGLAFGGFDFDFDDFDFGDDDDDIPGWIEAPWQPAPKYSFYPQMRSFDRSQMVFFRQQQMRQLASAMDRIGSQISGRDDFDRAGAINIASYIAKKSGENLMRNYHPGSVIDDDSRTTRSLWGNEELFKSSAVKMQEAAKALAEELKKEPAQAEGAVYLRAKWRRGSNGRETAAVSPQLRNKYNELSNTCNSCHLSFRSQYW